MISPKTRLLTSHLLPNFVLKLFLMNRKQDHIEGLYKGIRNLLLRTDDQISLLLNYAYQKNLRARTIGTGASWSDIIKTRDILIDTTKLNVVITKTPIPCRNNPEYVEVEVQAGMIVAEFCAELEHRFGLALPILGNYAGQTIGGLISTSSHGSSFHAQTMSNYVSQIKLISSRGIKLCIRRSVNHRPSHSLEAVKATIVNMSQSYNPCHHFIDIENDELFNSVAVAIGCYGAIYSVSFLCEKIYNIREIVSSSVAYYDRSEKRVLLPQDVQHGLKNENGDSEFFSFFVDPYISQSVNINITYIKGSRVAYNSQKNKESCNCYLCWITCGNICEKQGLSSTFHAMQTDISAALLHSFSQLNCSSNLSYPVRISMYGFQHSQPRVDVWYKVLQITKGNIRVRTAEWAIPLQYLENALFDVISQTNLFAEMYGFTSLLPIFVRLIKSDTLYLSPAYCITAKDERVSHFAFIEVPFLPGSFGIDSFHSKIEDLLLQKYGARPHWSKTNFLNAENLRIIYPHWRLWQTVQSFINIDGTFNSQFTDRCGLSV